MPLSKTFTFISQPAGLPARCRTGWGECCQCHSLKLSLLFHSLLGYLRYAELVGENVVIVTQCHSLKLSLLFHSLLGYLRDAELVEEDVVVIATHCHFDHSGGLHHFPQVVHHHNCHHRGWMPRAKLRPLVEIK